MSTIFLEEVTWLCLSKNRKDFQQVKLKKEGTLSEKQNMSRARGGQGKHGFFLATVSSALRQAGQHVEKQYGGQ